MKKPSSIWPETMWSHNGKKRKPKLQCSADEFSKKKGRLPYYPNVDGYETLGMISSGSCGIVYKVQDKNAAEIRAMKNEFSGMSSTMKTEIDILKFGGGHPSVVGFKEVAVDAYGGIYVVTKYMDLKRFMAEEVLPIAQVKMLMEKLIQGVNFLHQNTVVHRDLKPSNILVNDLEGGEKLNICYFGLSTRFEEELVSTVGTLWYMAPELLLGEKSYSCAVDMRGVGCIMAELVLRKMIFKWKSKEDQLHEIYCILGHPTANNVATIIYL